MLSFHVVAAGARARRGHHLLVSISRVLFILEVKGVWYKCSCKSWGGLCQQVHQNVPQIFRDCNLICATAHAQQVSIMARSKAFFTFLSTQTTSEALQVRNPPILRPTAADESCVSPLSGSVDEA